jgi:hypothetical protein
MQGGTYNFMLSTTIAIVAVVFIFITAALLPTTEPAEKH